MIINNPDNLDNKEIENYVKYVKELDSNKDKEINELTIKLVNDDEVELQYEASSIPFERIRRITGYLVGTLDRFNNAKRAEVEDRVKHSV